MRISMEFGSKLTIKRHRITFLEEKRKRLCLGRKGEKTSANSVSIRASLLSIRSKKKLLLRE